MGRTGRRSGADPQLPDPRHGRWTADGGCGSRRPLGEGYVEPATPPAVPYHILTQQLMALALQESGIGRRDWLTWIQRMPAFAGMPLDRIEGLVDWMLRSEILWEDHGILGMGRKGENTYGRRNFLELFSVFVSPPTFRCIAWSSRSRICGRTDLLREARRPSDPAAGWAGVDGESYRLAATTSLCRTH